MLWFSSSHVWIWELDNNESWAPNNRCFWTVVLEKTFESPLDCKEIQPVHPKGDQSWMFIEKTEGEAETLILLLPNAKGWLIWKGPDAGKDWRWEEKGTTKDEMVGWHHWLNGHEFESTLGVGDGQEGLTCCSPWGCKELDMTEWLNWTEPMLIRVFESQQDTHDGWNNRNEVFNRKCIIYRLTFQGITNRTSKRNYQPTWRTGNSRGLQSQVVIKRKQLSQGVHDMLSPTPQNIE